MKVARLPPPEPNIREKLGGPFHEILIWQELHTLIPYELLFIHNIISSFSEQLCKGQGGGAREARAGDWGVELSQTP